jgi:hypothetical protein
MDRVRDRRETGGAAGIVLRAGMTRNRVASARGPRLYRRKSRRERIGHA